MPRYTHTDIPALLEAEEKARKRAENALLEMIQIQDRIIEAAGEEDRRNYRDPHYRRGRLDFQRFIRGMKGVKRTSLAVLGSLSNIRISDYVSSEALIKQAKDEDAAKEARKERREQSARAARARRRLQRELGEVRDQNA